MNRRHALLGFAAVAGGCASLTRDPIQVQLADVEPLEGAGMEARFLCKLRIQNPNDAPIAFDGLFVDLQVHGSTLATGVSDQAGTVPRFGEVVVDVPVTVSAMNVARQAIGLFTASAGERGRVDYVLKGKISGPGFGGARFESRGELSLPALLAGQ